MAKDDMFVIMFKILSYLYECMKTDVKPEKYKYSAAYLGVPESYWQKIILELKRHQYVRGVEVTEYMDGKTIITLQNPYITSEGVQFLGENTMIAKAIKFLKSAKEAAPFL